MVDRTGIFGALLAGGAGARIGGDKAMTLLAGVPLIAHVANTMAWHVDALAVVGDDPAATELHATPLRDIGDAGHGPLYGVSAALTWARTGGAEWLAIAPCDTPFLPHDWIERLRRAAAEHGAPLAYAQSPSGMHPLVSLWRVELVDALEVVLSGGHRAVHTVIATFGAAGAAFSEDALANVNTREDLAAAEARLAQPRSK
jgi:molybdopterin-guanine dinucleotide biosynthesis protein A